MHKHTLCTIATQRSVRSCIVFKVNRYARLVTLVHDLEVIKAIDKWKVFEYVKTDTNLKQNGFEVKFKKFMKKEEIMIYIKVVTNCVQYDIVYVKVVGL